MSAFQQIIESIDCCLVINETSSVICKTPLVYSSNKFKQLSFSIAGTRFQAARDKNKEADVVPKHEA